MAQSLIVLGGYQLPYNAFPYQDVRIRSAQYQETLESGFLTDFSVIPQDTEIVLTWSILDRSVYLQLYSMFIASSAVYTYVDPYGTNMHVFFSGLEYKSLLEGGDDGLEEVVVKLRILSLP